MFTDLANDPLIILGFVFVLALLAFFIGRASKPSKRTSLATEADIEEIAMEEIATMLWNKDIGHREFGDECEKIRESHWEIAKRLQKRRGQSLKK